MAYDIYALVMCFLNVMYNQVHFMFASDYAIITQNGSHFADELFFPWYPFIQNIPPVVRSHYA